MRHGATEWNLSKRHQGQTDISLSELGRAQAARLCDRLTNVPVDVIYSSDLSRAAETAAISNSELNRPVVLAKELREIAFGHWEGLTYEEIRSRYPEELRHSQEERLDFKPAGGESLRSVDERLAHWASEVGIEQPDTTILVVSHRGALRVLLCRLLGLPPTSYWRLWIDCCGLSTVDCYDEGCILSLLNDTSHLKGLSDAG